MDNWQTTLIVGLLACVWCMIMVNFYQHRLNKLTGERLKQLESGHPEGESDS